MKIITLAQQKGGVGKTTLAIHLAAEAIRKGARAVVIERDQQGTASQWAEARANAAEGDLLGPVDDTRKPPEVISSAGHSEHEFDRILADLAGRYDYAFIDVPGANFVGVNNAMRRADLTLIPTRPTTADIVASMETLKAVHRLNRPYAYVLVLSVSRSRTERVREEFEDAGHAIAPNGIAHRLVFQDAIGHGMTVQELEPHGQAATEIRQLWRWLREQLRNETKQAS